MIKKMIGYDFHDGPKRGLEYHQALPPRTPLAGPATIQRVTCEPKEWSRRKRRLASCFANGLPEHDHAGQRFSPRRRPLIFEPANSAVTKTAIGKNPDSLDPLLVRKS
jgi:hypothetical protein